MRIRMRFALAFAALALLLAAAAAAEGRAAIMAGTIVVVDNPDARDRLNLRTGPGRDAPTLGKYYNGTYLETLSDERDGWVKVRIFDLEGYMRAEFLTYPDQLWPGAATLPTVSIQNVGGTGLNLRKTQSMNSSSLGLYKNGSMVRVFGVSETWCHVQAEDGRVGFMLREKLSPVLEFQKSGGNTNVTASGGALRPVSSFAVVDNPNSIDRLNLRTLPSQDAPTLGKYYSGTTVEVLSDDQNGWTKVRVDTLEGYMMTRYLAVDQNQFAVTSAMPSVKVQNPNGTGLNLRQAPSTGAASFGLYGNGAVVRVLGVSESWCHVQTEDGRVGFMLREDLSPSPDFEREKITGDMLEGSWIVEPLDSETENFIPGGNG